MIKYKPTWTKVFLVFYPNTFPSNSFQLKLLLSKQACSLPVLQDTHASLSLILFDIKICPTLGTENEVTTSGGEVPIENTTAMRKRSGLQNLFGNKNFYTMPSNVKKKRVGWGMSWRKGGREIKKCSDIKTNILYEFITLLICSLNSNPNRKQFTPLRLLN